MSQQNVKTATHESKETSGVKPSATKKTPRKAAGSVVSEALMTALEATPVEMVAYTQLRDTELNCRIVPHTDQEITDLAETIKGIGILQNLVVVEEQDGTLGVVAGSGRKRATGLLVEQGIVKADQRFIPVKKISREMAVVASMTENGQRKQMHPAEQIVGFRTLSGEGKTDAQIGDLLGYGSRHVQRMLKLAGLAPAILDSLAKDELTTEHCHALALESDQDRQLQVLEAARQNGYNNKPQIHEIRTLITASEVSTASNKFVFVGRDAFSDAEIRRDLFSDAEEGYVDRLLLDTRVMDKLKQVAEELKTREGWSWCLARMEGIAYHGEDAKNWRLTYEPDLEYTPEEEHRRDALSARLEALPEDSEEASAIEAEYTMIEEAAQARAWTDEQKAAGGVVVSFNRELVVQRGVVVKVQGSEEESSNAVSRTHSLREPDPADDISIPLLTKMSSERTLAVRGALAKQPARAFAVLVWTLCQKVFHAGYVQESPMRINLECSDYSLCNDAPSGETGVAYIGIQDEKKHLELLLPAGWKQEVSTFFSLSEDVLMALAGFCGAMSINGVQTRDCGHTSRSPLNRLEKAIDFHMRDWWQPTKANYFDHIGKTQIIEVLNQCKLTGAASDAEKMKKGDAAEHAEHLLATSRWVPDWMTSKDAQSGNEEDEPEVLEAEATITHTDAA